MLIFGYRLFYKTPGRADKLLNRLYSKRNIQFFKIEILLQNSLRENQFSGNAIA